MKNLLEQKFDSDSDDEDYVPNEQKNNSPQDQAECSDDQIQKGGIQGLKAQKRKKEIDDLFDLMNEDDPFMSKMKQRKQQKIQTYQPETKIDVAKGQQIQNKQTSQLDQSKDKSAGNEKILTNEQQTLKTNSKDNNDDLSQNHQCSLQSNLKSQKSVEKEISQESQEKQVKIKKVDDESKDTFNAALAAIQAMKQKNQNQIKQEKVHYAGRQYTVERTKTQQDIDREEKSKRKQQISASSGLDSLVSQIDGKDKNVNCVQKSKLDWDNYTKENKLEGELEKNRKDGFLAKRKFLEKVIDKEYEHKKKIEKIHQQAQNK